MARLKSERSVKFRALELVLFQACTYYKVAQLNFRFTISPLSYCSHFFTKIGKAFMQLYQIVHGTSEQSTPHNSCAG